jgi:uncharacterized protein
MTPEERNLVTQLLDRLATLEDAQRDPEAERLIRDGLRQAPNAPYSLVQTVLVQDEALKRADAHIRQLESELGVGQEPQRQGGFLDNMRDALFGGRREEPRQGSVPSVGPGDRPMGSPWNSRPQGQNPSGLQQQYPGGWQAPQAGMQSQMPPAEPSRGGSFLGTAAAAAAGAIGGSLLLNSFRGMMGPHGGGTSHAAFDPPTESGGGRPWGGSGGGDGDLARQAGLDDIGRGSSGGRDYSDAGGGGGGVGLFGGGDDSDAEADDSTDFADGGDGGDSDTA